MSQVMMTGTRQKVRRNRILILVGAAVVLAFTFAFAHLTMTAIKIRKNTSDVFMQWVIDNHIGKAKLFHDSTGFDNDFMTVTVNKPTPVKQLQQQTLTLMKEYQHFDGGESLTVQYQPPGKSKAVQESTAEYVSGSNTVFITLHQGMKPDKVVKTHVNWPYVPPSS